MNASISTVDANKRLNSAAGWRSGLVGAVCDSATKNMTEGAKK
jgi:hypothetical protein